MEARFFPVYQRSQVPQRDLAVLAIGGVLFELVS